MSPDKGKGEAADDVEGRGEGCSTSVDSFSHVLEETVVNTYEEGCSTTVGSFPHVWEEAVVNTYQDGLHWGRQRPQACPSYSATGICNMPFECPFEHDLPYLEYWAPRPQDHHTQIIYQPAPVLAPVTPSSSRAIEESSNHTLLMNHLGYPIHPGVYFCKDYVTTGSCPYGIACPNNHPRIPTAFLPATNTPHQITPDVASATGESRTPPNQPIIIQQPYIWPPGYYNQSSPSPCSVLRILTLLQIHNSILGKGIVQPLTALPIQWSTRCSSSMNMNRHDPILTWCHTSTRRTTTSPMVWRSCRRRQRAPIPPRQRVPTPSRSQRHPNADDGPSLNSTPSDVSYNLASLITGVQIKFLSLYLGAILGRLMRVGLVAIHCFQCWSCS